MIQDIAELLSAFAAFITVGLAAIELYSRRKSNNADIAIETYSDYLFVEQQICYAVSSATRFAQDAGKAITELVPYASTHVIDQSLRDKIYEIQKNSICCSNYNSAAGKRNASAIMECAGASLDLITMINTFYTTIAAGNVTVEWINENVSYIIDGFEVVKEKSRDVVPILNSHVKKYHNFSNFYLIGLFIAMAVFMVICLMIR